MPRPRSQRSPRSGERASADRAPARVLIVPDKFKGTLTAKQAAQAIARGLREAWPRSRLTICEISDGGDGFARTLVRATGGTLRFAKSVDAAGRPQRCSWGLLPDGRTAVVDIASASGLGQLPQALRDPSRTTTLGTGLLVRRAIASGARTIIVGLGGSATNDGGIGFASALGYRFIDKRGRPIELNGHGLSRLAHVVPPEELPPVRFIAATDVDSPLFGPRGAAHQFAAQKGASRRMIAELDAALRLLAKVVRRDLHVDCARTPGAGTAGGCGYALFAMFGATRVAGFELVRKFVHLDQLIDAHDLVITGEGCLDRSSLRGKAPIRVAALAREHGVPAWGVFGRIRLPSARRYFSAFTAVASADARGEPRGSTAVHAQRLSEAAARLARELV